MLKLQTGAPSGQLPPVQLRSQPISRFCQLSLQIPFQVCAPLLCCHHSGKPRSPLAGCEEPPWSPCSALASCLPFSTHNNRSGLFLPKVNLVMSEQWRAHAGGTPSSPTTIPLGPRLCLPQTPSSGTVSIWTLVGICTEVPRVGWLRNRKLCSHNSEAQKSELKVSAEVISSMASLLGV